jgi:hypothetical protein
MDVEIEVLFDTFGPSVGMPKSIPLNIVATLATTKQILK